MEEFEYHRELFHGLSTILQDVRHKVKQEKLPHAMIAGLNSDNPTKILAALEVVMTYVKTSGTKSPDQTIGEYCAMWQFSAADVLVLKTAALSDIQMQHLVSLYEEVENLVATRVTEWLDKAYDKPVPNPEKVKEHLNKISPQHRENLVVALRRFMFRFLSVEQISASNPLSHYAPHLVLCLPHESNMDEETLNAQLPPSICVANTYAFFTLLRSMVEVTQTKTTTMNERKKVAQRQTKNFNNM
jgi:hypothetical protein